MVHKVCHLAPNSKLRCGETGLSPLLRAAVLAHKYRLISGSAIMVILTCSAGGLICGDTLACMHWTTDDDAQPMHEADHKGATLKSATSQIPTLTSECKLHRGGQELGPLIPASTESVTVNRPNPDTLLGADPGHAARAQAPRLGFSAGRGRPRLHSGAGSACGPPVPQLPEEIPAALCGSRQHGPHVSSARTCSITSLCIQSP